MWSYGTIERGAALAVPPTVVVDPRALGAAATRMVRDTRAEPLPRLVWIPEPRAGTARIRAGTHMGREGVPPGGQPGRADSRIPLVPQSGVRARWPLTEPGRSDPAGRRTTCS